MTDLGIAAPKKTVQQQFETAVEALAWAMADVANKRVGPQVYRTQEEFVGDAAALLVRLEPHYDLIPKGELIDEWGVLGNLHNIIGREADPAVSRAAAENFISALHLNPKRLRKRKIYVTPWEAV